MGQRRGRAALGSCLPPFLPPGGAWTWQAAFDLAEDWSRETADLRRGRGPHAGPGGSRALPQPVLGPRTPNMRDSSSKAGAACPCSRTPRSCGKTGRLRATTGTDARGCDFKDARASDRTRNTAPPLGRDGDAACGKRPVPSAAAAPGMRTCRASVRAGHTRHRTARTGRRGPACGLRASRLFLLQPSVTKTSCIV